ncbi:hypothetical protein EYC84_005456 [Monilinia fructicola]|uniref:Uncharacterized protein n=1 Tax=Monilinia fructicola TaxID=38448 RepID=A0A5M9JXF5_MONFR|nr:hypothetical protein EYC84_005456 [Monilinia fructicola]
MRDCIGSLGCTESSTVVTYSHKTPSISIPFHQTEKHPHHLRSSSSSYSSKYHNICQSTNSLSWLQPNAPAKKIPPHAQRPKSPATVFKVGPDNLPDGTWRRKVIAIKKDLIHKAKVKKSYAKLRAREPLKDERNIYAEDQAKEKEEEEEEEDVKRDEEREETGEEAVELHPQRKAMLDEPEVDTAVKIVPRYSNNSEDSREKKRERSEKRGRKASILCKGIGVCGKSKGRSKKQKEKSLRGRKGRRRLRLRRGRDSEDRWRRLGVGERMVKGSWGERARCYWRRSRELLVIKIMVMITGLRDVKAVTAVTAAGGKIGETYDTHEVIANEWREG